MIEFALALDSEEQLLPVAVEESLAVYGYEWSPQLRTWFKGGRGVDRIDLPPNLVQTPALEPTCYRRVVQRVGLWWHLFGFWWLDNPWSIEGVGRHEGDWEILVVVTTDEEGDKPIFYAGSQHHRGGKRAAWAHKDVRDGRAVFYVARGSHAIYFTPGHHRIDYTDGAKVIDDIRVLPFGAWANWPGVMGNSDNSPRAPARQNHRWNALEVFFSEDCEDQ